MSDKMATDWVPKKQPTACYELLVIVNDSLMTFCCGEISDCEDRFLKCDPFPEVGLQVMRSWGIAPSTIEVKKERWFNTQFVHSIVNLGENNE